MTGPARITASFSVVASTFGEGEADVSGLTPDEVAELVWTVVAAYPTMCHQCAGSVIDPEIGELTGFAVNGVHYEQVDGHWLVAS